MRDRGWFTEDAPPIPLCSDFESSTYVSPYDDSHTTHTTFEEGSRAHLGVRPNLGDTERSEGCDTVRLEVYVPMMAEKAVSHGQRGYLYGVGRELVVQMRTKRFSNGSSATSHMGMVIDGRFDTHGTEIETELGKDMMISWRAWIGKV